MKEYETPTAFNPVDCERFFRCMGARRLRRAILIGEVDGDTLEKARLWLEFKNQTSSRFWMIFGSVVAVLGVAVTVAAWLATH